MPKLYQSADVFVQCSKDEPFPLVFLEAMACGVPIVGHDMPRVRWFVGEHEFLADMNDPAAIAEAIERASASGSFRTYSANQQSCRPFLGESRGDVPWVL